MRRQMHGKARRIWETVKRSISLESPTKVEGEKLGKLWADCERLHVKEFKFHPAGMGKE